MPLDYSGQNLRGRSFRGKNLEGANFSGADIRSADFTNALLIGANFSGAEAGLQQHWVVGLVVCSWLLAGLSGFLSGIVGAASAIADAIDTRNFIRGIVLLIRLRLGG